MEQRLVQQALSDEGLLTRDALQRPRARSLQRSGLVVVQPGVVAAATQPLGADGLVRAVSLSVRPPFAFLGRTALWRYGVLPPPSVVEVGVPSTRGLTVHPPVLGRRVAPGLLERCLWREGVPLVRLEVAVVQSAADLPLGELRRVVESLLRERRTTSARLLAMCRRGVAGSTALRGVLHELQDGDLELQQRRLRRALQAAGVVGLESEVRLVSRGGATCYLDLLHRPSHRAVETDGSGTHGTAEQQLVDRRRDRWVLLDHGIVTTRVTASEVREGLPDLVAELLPLFSRPA